MSQQNSRIYLDHAATTALLPGVKARMVEAMAQFGNPSSLHEHGRMAKHKIDWAREKVASALGCLFAEVVFTAGGTEAANLAIVGSALANEDSRRRRVLLSAVEHHCVLSTRFLLERLGYAVDLIPVDRESRVRLDALESMLSDDVFLVSVMSANNETGVIQDVSEGAKLVHQVGALFHTDHVQGLLKFPPCASADLVSISAHKVNGPKGVGALAVLNGTKIKPLVAGGEQEREMRGGTENVVGIVGFGAAIDLHQDPLVGAARDRLREILVEAGAVVTVPTAPTLDGHLHVRFPSIDAETMLIRLDREGISASSGAACSSGSIEPSHVLLACGFSEVEAKEGLRFSFGYGNTIDEAEQAGNIIRRVIDEIRGRRNA